MSLLLLFGGAQVVTFTPIAHGKLLAVTLPDEVAVGQTYLMAVEVVDSTGNYPLDEPAQVTVWGFDQLSVRTLVWPTAQVLSNGFDNVYDIEMLPLYTAGNYEIIVTAIESATTYVVQRSITARPKFDPIALADEDILVSRMGNETHQTQP